VQNTTEQEQLEKVIAEAEDEITGQASGSTETGVGDCYPVKEVVQPAYRTYLEARKVLAEAFRHREYLDQEACREAERQYQLTKEAIEMAIKVRERAEHDALVAYTEKVDKAVNKVSQIYKEAIEMAIKVREKAEHDALAAYTEELDKAVSEASQAYKDEMEQAIMECKQRVMDAWRGSIETSTKITGVFEQDRNMNTSPAQPLSLFEALVDQPG
jgi:hypothetical protein